MTEPNPSSFRLELELSPDQPGLLDGLDHWLRLGLLTEAQVLTLGQTHLSCDWPIQPASSGADDPFLYPSALPLPGRPSLSTAASAGNPFLGADADASDPAIAPATAAPASLPDFLAPPGAAAPASRAADRSRPQRGTSARAAIRVPGAPIAPINSWIQRLMSELSVVWLLGLGVFLVVLSSAVLAATQWAEFNAAGQYLVLLAYTLVFWGMGLWSSRSANLRLTATTLQIITLLLVPLNIWAIDGLGVAGSAAGLVIALGAAGLLAVATVQLLRRQRASLAEQANVLVLAYLHWGWAWGGMAGLAAYAGALTGAGVLLLERRRSKPADPHQPHPRQVIPPFGLPQLVIGFALGLLLLRVLTVLPPQQWGQMGLAFGLYGATWVWLGQAPEQERPGLTSSAEAAAPRAAAFRLAVGLGRGLLWLGWLMAIDDWRAQAFGVSVLGLGLRLRQLARTGRRRDLFWAFAIALQLGLLGWALLPVTLRASLSQPMITGLNAAADPDLLLGIVLYPYVVGLVGLADYYGRRQQLALSRFSVALAIGLNGLLTAISCLNGAVLVVNLVASTATAFIGTLRRRSPRPWQVMICQGLLLATILVTVQQQFPALPSNRWLGLIFALAVGALLISRGLTPPWQTGAWRYGLGLSGLAYVLLGDHLIATSGQSPLSWLGLTLPLTFTLIGRHRFSLLATGLTAPLTLGLPWTRLVGLGSAAVLTFLNSRRQPSLPVALMALGFCLGFVVSLLADALPIAPANPTHWCLVTVGLILGLWGIWRWLPSASPGEATDPWPKTRYRQASDIWGHLLTVGLLLYGTYAVSQGYFRPAPPELLIVLALVGLLAALIWRYGQQPQPGAVYLAGWGLELLLAALVARQQPTALALATPTLGLAALWVGLTFGLRHRWPELLPSLRQLGLGYGILALLLRSGQFTAWTGWLVVAASLLALEIGRQNQSSILRRMALLGLSWGWFELVLYPLAQAEAGAAADGLVILAGVAVLIMITYRGSAGWLERRLNLPDQEFIAAAHIHWVAGTLLLGITGALLTSQPYTLAWLALPLGLSLVAYALAQGRPPTRLGAPALWISLGLLQLVGWFSLLRLSFPSLAALDNWWGTVACAIALGVYWLPWTRGGWPLPPFQRMAVGVPLGVTVLTASIGHIPTLAVLVGFYGWLAWAMGRIQVSYLAVGCAIWAIWVELDRQGSDDQLLFTIPAALGLLYLAQVDPELRQPENKVGRHWLRVMTTAVVLLLALLSSRWTGLPTAGLALLGIVGGLLLRTRAYLFTGTAIFGINAINQLILLNTTYPLIKWVLGILVGIGLIWIAADFERRREQWLNLTQDWAQDLDDWQ